MGEREADIPDAERFNAREERVYRDTIEHDPHVLQAVELMSTSPMDKLLDELLVLQAADQPDQAKLDDLRGRMANEAALRQADEVTTENAEQHLVDVSASAEQLDREHKEALVKHFREELAAIHGLADDIQAMADEVLGDAAEKYPQDMADVLDQASKEHGAAVEGSSDLLGLDIADDLEVCQQTLLDYLSAAGAEVPMDTLIKVGRQLATNRNTLVDLHTTMMKLADHFRHRTA